MSDNMNTYLYPWHTDTDCKIEKVIAKNFQDCEYKIIERYCNRFDDLDDRLSFEDFCIELGNEYGVYLGTIYELDELI